MDMTTLIVAVVLVIAIGLLAYYVPAFRLSLWKLVTKQISDKEHLIVLSVYNNLPPQIKKYIDSKLLSEIIGFVIEYGLKTLLKK